MFVFKFAKCKISYQNATVLHMNIEKTLNNDKILSYTKFIFKPKNYVHEEAKVSDKVSVHF